MNWRKWLRWSEQTEWHTRVSTGLGVLVLSGVLQVAILYLAEVPTGTLVVTLLPLTLAYMGGLLVKS